MTDRTASTALQVRENGLVSQSGGLLLAETLRATGLGQGLAGWLARWRAPRAVQRQRVLIRTDSGGGTHDFLAWLASPGRRLHYSISMPITDDMQQAILQMPDRIWDPAYDADRQVRPGAWVAQLTGSLDLSGWPDGMRVIVRKERPHPGAQLRFTDGHRFTAFATDAHRGQLADLELRHRRRARCEDRIRNAKDTGLRNLPLHCFAQDQLRRDLALGHPAHHPRSPARAGLRAWLTTTKAPLRPGRTNPVPVEPRRPGATAGKPRHGQALKISKRPQSQPDSSRSRNIDAKRSPLCLFTFERSAVQGSHKGERK
jgi:Transposase DDE domain group 1